MDATGSPPTPPREAKLLREARLARGYSVDQAIDRMAIKLSISRWWHIERGYKSRTEPVRAPAKTLAHMARVVGLTPDRLDEVDRTDAADILREIERQAASAEQSYADLADPEERSLWELRQVPEEVRRDLIDVLRRARGKGRRAG